MRESIYNLWNRWYTHYKVQKNKEKKWDLLLGKELKGTEGMFNAYTMGWLVVAVTLFLQCISLATTYEGSKVYFGGIDLPFGISAAFLFAFSIQSIVFAMSHTLKNSMKKGIVAVLLLATLCSTYFSYVGIYNYIHSPIQYLEERYMQVYGTMTDKYMLISDKINTSMKESVFELTTTLHEAAIRLEKQVEENIRLKKELDKIKVDTGKIKPNTNGVVKPNIKHYGDNLDQYYADMQKYHAAINTVISNTTAKDQELKNTLYEQEVKAVLGGKSKDEFLKESIDTQTQKEQLNKTLESMYVLIKSNEAQSDTINAEEKLYKIQDYILDYIVSGQGEVEKVNTLLTQLSTQVNMIQGEDTFKDFGDQLTKFILVSQKDKEFIASLEEINQVDVMQLYSEMQAEINKGAHILNQLQQNTVDLEDEAYAMHNLYVLPIKNLQTSSMAWFCLVFAVLVDGLTLLFALMERKKKSLLRLNKNKQITARSEEEIEKLIITTLLNTNKHQSNTLIQIHEKLESFLNNFCLLPEGMKEGYSMWCRLECLKDYHMFVGILCQFNLAVILKGDEMQIVGNEAIDEDAEYVLLRTKFILWANEKITYWESESDGLLAYKEFNI